MTNYPTGGVVGSICVQNLMFLALPVTKLGRVPKFKNSTQDPHHTPLGYFVIHEMENTKIYPYIKFEVSSFNRSKFRDGVPKFKILAPDPMTPLWGYFVIHEMGHALLYTKFEVSSFIRLKFKIPLRLPWPHFGDILSSSVS